MAEDLALIAYDVPDRPRVLLCRFDHYDGHEGLLDGLVPTWQHMTDDGLNKLRTSSWNAVISRDTPVDGAAEWFYLQFGGRPWGQTPGRAHVSTNDSWSSDFYINGELPEKWRDELRSSIRSALRNAALPRQVIDKGVLGRFASYTPLVVDADGHALAAIYRPAYGGVEVIYLPAECEPSRAWIALALERWSSQNSEAFPPGASWTEHPDWMSADEIAASIAIDRLSRAREEAIDRLNQELNEARTALAGARQIADTTVRRLLTSKDDELVNEVADTLRVIGFNVEDRDALGGREKLEDLRAKLSSFNAIVEVKGSSGGASTTHLLKMSRFTKAYQRETGAYPDAQWYIFNSFRDRDPSTRRMLLQGQDDSVVEFGNNDGVAIDTRDLFRLRRDVSNGIVSPDAAQDFLVKARGRFSYLPHDDEALDAVEHTFEAPTSSGAVE